MLIDYVQCGDYLIPCLVLNEPPKELTEPITRYGRIRREFMREHHPITYSRLLLTERLYPHLREIQTNAEKELDRIMSEMMSFRPPPDKAADGISWATYMETVKRTAEKIMLDEIVYA